MMVKKLLKSRYKQIFSKRAQASVEFTILVAFGILFLSVVAGVFFTQITLLNEDLKQDALNNFVNRVEYNVNLVNSFDSYVYLPFETGMNDYSFIYTSNPANYSLINSSIGENLVFFDAPVDFLFRGDNSLYCVTKSSTSLLLSNQFIALQADNLFFGCVNNLQNVSLEFDGDISTAGLFNNPDFVKIPITLSVSGPSNNILTIDLSIPLSGSFYLADNIGVNLIRVVSINSHLSEIQVIS